jgi:hypothetical protein
VKYISAIKKAKAIQSDILGFSIKFCKPKTVNKKSGK